MTPPQKVKKVRPPALPRKWFLQVTWPTESGSATANSRTWTKEVYAWNNARRYQSAGIKVAVVRGVPA